MAFNCTVCNTEYKSYKSLWNHNDKFHSDLNIKITTKKYVGNYTCTKCNKKFTRKNNMILHMNKHCKNKNKLDPNTDLQQQIMELQKEIKELKGQRIANTINNGNMNNGTVNNIVYINKTGTENMLELNKKEIAEIFDKDISGLLTFVEKVNFNERLPSNHSFCTTNLGGPYLSVYDTEKSKVKQDRKKYFFEEIISKTVAKMEELYKINKNHFKPTKQKSIEDTLKRLNELKSMDMNKKIFKEMSKQLNILSYNDREVVETTWDNSNIKGKVPLTFEEDLEMSSENDDNKIEESNSDSDSELESKLKNLFNKNKIVKPKELVV
jgi:hypothetical protein